jgi:hypothetical protein
MRRAFGFLGAIAAMVLAAGVLAAPASAYGGGASHDMWQVGLSFNCNNPDYCGPELGGFWGWVEFDRAGTTTWGDAALAGCGHTVGGGDPGTAGAGGVKIEILAWHLAPAGAEDPNPGGQIFYIDANEVTFTGHGNPVTVVNDPEFLGDSGIPAEPGHYAFHPVAGVAGEIQVAFRPAK